MFSKTKGWIQWNSISNNSRILNFIYRNLFFSLIWRFLHHTFGFIDNLITDRVSSHYKSGFPGMGISIIKIRRSGDSLIFITGILRLVIHLYAKTDPKALHFAKKKHPEFELYADRKRNTHTLLCTLSLTLSMMSVLNWSRIYSMRFRFFAFLCYWTPCNDSPANPLILVPCVYRNSAQIQ